MPKRIAIRIVNLIWYSAAILIVLAAMTVAMGRELLPHIDLDNEKLAHYASKKLGADIAVHHLRGQWIRLFPEFTASNIDIHTPTLQVHMEDVHLDIDILRSALLRSPVFDRFELAAANITYTSGETAATPDTEKTWRIIYLLLNKNIRVHNVNIAVQTQSIIHPLHIADFRVEQALLNKRFFLKLLGEDEKQSLAITGTVNGNTLANSSGNLYITSQDWSFQEWLPHPDDNTASTLRDLLQTNWHANGEVWFTWQGLDKISSTANLQLHSNTNNNTPLPNSASGSLSLDWQRGQESKLQLHELILQKQDNTINVLQDTVFTFHDAARWRLQTPALSLDNLSTLTTWLPDSPTKEMLLSLQPTGKLARVDLRWDNNKPRNSRMQLRANPDNISTGAWHGVPAFTQVSGYLETGIEYGFIDLDSQQGFSMHYPGVFHEPLLFQRAAGRVQWHWLPEEKTVLVGSDHASLLGKAGEADGNFWLYLPLPGSDRHSEMNLAIGLRNSRASQRDQFLPYTLPETLLAWLKNSIGEADIQDAGFIYRGPLAGHDAFARAVQFYANFDKGDLQFEQNWPRLTQLQGKVLVDDGNVDVRTQGGQIYNTALESAMVNVINDGKGSTVYVNGRARGYAEDGLRILRETPLRKSLGSSFDNWRITHGLITAGLQLAIPLNGNNSAPQEDIQVSLFDTQLIMDDLHLQFDETQGDIHYQTDKGLTAPELKTHLFQQAVGLRIDSKKTSDALTINIKGSGKASCSDIAQWSRLRPLQMLSGDFDYNADLTLGPFGKKPQPHIGQLQISSDMQQTAVQLPPPFNKKAGEKAPLTLTVDLYQDNRQEYHTAYNKQISGAIVMRSGQLFGGELIAGESVALGQTAQLPLSNGPLRIHGKLPDGDLQQWLDVVSTYNRLPQLQNSNDTLYPAFSFNIENALWRDLNFPALQLDITHPENAWNIQFNSSHAKGYVNFYDTTAAMETPRPDLVFTELKIYHTRKVETAETFGTEPSALANVNFSEVPSLNIRIDHLFFNDMDIGNVNTQLLSSDNALQFNKLQMTGPGFAVRGKDDNPDATMMWRRNADGVYQSEFHGMLHMQGEQPALKHLGVDPFVRGENIYLASDLAWAGSPLDFAMPALYGRVQTHGQKGKYLQASPNAAMQAISVVNIANWVRRLRLDFSDLTSDGISFDEYHGEISFNNGDMAFSEPLTVQSPSSSMVLSGVSHLNTGQLDLKLTATLPVSSNATWITALAGGLPAAAGVYLVSKIFGDEIKNITSLTYSITGPSTEPDVRFERLAAPKEKTPAAKNIP